MTPHAVDPTNAASPDIERLRTAALALVEAGLPIAAKELALILRVGVSQVHKQEKAGAYDDLKLTRPLGPKRYSGILVARWLRGEPLVDIHFGRKTFRQRV